MKSFSYMARVKNNVKMNVFPYWLHEHITHLSFISLHRCLCLKFYTFVESKMSRQSKNIIYLKRYHRFFDFVINGIVSFAIGVVGVIPSSIIDWLGWYCISSTLKYFIIESKIVKFKTFFCCIAILVYDT